MNLKKEIYTQQVQNNKKALNILKAKQLKLILTIK